MLKRIALTLFLPIILTACNETGQNQNSSQSGGRSLNVMGSIRPKADPAVVEQIKQEELAAIKEQQMRDAALANSMNNNNLDPNQRNLPDVGMSALPPNSQQTTNNDSNTLNGFWPFGNSNNQNNQNNSNNNQVQNSMNSMNTIPSSPSVASYGNYNSPSSGALIPPPPAVTLSTQATVPYGGQDPYNPYGQYNPYMMAQPPAPSNMGRPAGSLFGSQSSGGMNNDGGDNSESNYKIKKANNITVITPTGMDARSPYKQRDDLRVLWKGAIASSAQLSNDKFVASLNKVDIALPGESSKGTLSVQQRQVDHTFKSQSLDKHIQSAAKKAQAELVQSYYRYLYAYNKFSLAQQTVAARRQEVEVAESASEKQRAAADLSQAQNEAESSKEDLKAAQSDLAAISGAQAARTIISHVSGIAPNIDSLAQADNNEPANVKNQNKGNNAFTGFITSALGFGKGKNKSEKQTNEQGEGKDLISEEKSAPAENVSETKAEQAKAETPIVPVVSGKNTILFDLRDVQTTPRKSILRVAIRNTTNNEFNFNPEVVSVSEGNHKLAEAAVRAEFDSTVVPPNQEITGTITIFGRPWNDKLTVSLSDGGKTIQLHR